MKIILFLIATTAIADPAQEIARAQEFNTWIHESLEYVISRDDILEPMATIRLGGDCADFSALLVSMLADEGIHAEMLLLDLKNFKPHHAYVRLWGMYFDPVYGTMSSEEFPLLHKVTHKITLRNILFAPKRDK